jgi:hypothetical protein
MRQDQIPNNQGSPAKAQDDANSQTSILNSLTESLKAIHPADLLKGARVLAVFAREHMRERSYKSPSGDTFSASEELARTVLAVLRSDPGQFTGVLLDYGQLVFQVNCFVFNIAENAAADSPEEIAATLCYKELDRIERCLGFQPSGSVEPFLDPVCAYALELSEKELRSLKHQRALRKRCTARLSEGFVLPEAAAICAAILVALLVWNLTVDHFALWQLLAAVALIAGVCQLCRLGYKRAQLQTPVLKADS